MRERVRELRGGRSELRRAAAESGFDHRVRGAQFVAQLLRRWMSLPEGEHGAERGQEMDREARRIRAHGRDVRVVESDPHVDRGHDHVRAARRQRSAG